MTLPGIQKLSLLNPAPTADSADMRVHSFCDEFKLLSKATLQNPCCLVGTFLMRWPLQHEFSRNSFFTKGVHSGTNSTTNSRRDRIPKEFAQKHETGIWSKKSRFLRIYSWNRTGVRYIMMVSPYPCCTTTQNRSWLGAPPLSMRLSWIQMDSHSMVQFQNTEPADVSNAKTPKSHQCVWVQVLLQQWHDMQNP